MDAQLPAHFYYIVGFLIITNLSVIGSIIFAAFRAVWYFRGEHDRLTVAHEKALNAHRRINELEKRKD